jgi:hypothetical protein
MGLQLLTMASSRTRIAKDELFKNTRDFPSHCLPYKTDFGNSYSVIAKVFLFFNLNTITTIHLYIGSSPFHTRTWVAVRGNIRSAKPKVCSVWPPWNIYQTLQGGKEMEHFFLHFSFSGWKDRIVLQNLYSSRVWTVLASIPDHADTKNQQRNPWLQKSLLEFWFPKLPSTTHFSESSDSCFMYPVTIFGCDPWEWQGHCIVLVGSRSPTVEFCILMYSMSLLKPQILTSCSQIFKFSKWQLFY